MSFRKACSSIALIAVAMLLGTASPGLAAGAKEVGGLDETGPYTPVENWFKPGFRWNQLVTSVAVDNPNRILIATSIASRPGSNPMIIEADGRVVAPGSGRAAPAGEAPPKLPHEHLILALNADGRVVEDWSQWNDLITTAHNILINPYDKARSVWVIDREGQQVLKFSNDGKKLLLKIGEKGVAGTDHSHFNLPAGMAFMPDGSFYVADGYKNARVVKFDANGKFLLEWGSKGSGPGQFNLVHGVAIDGRKQVYVADRSNNRIQIFDENGKYLREWGNIRSPAFLQVSADNRSLWLSSNSEDRMAKFDMEGRLQTYFGVQGSFPGALNDLHAFAVDQSGNLYIADCFNNRLQKFVPKTNAERARLVDQPFVFH